ncbi:carboxypeptidase regulatory-like domain-containing protein [Telmatobacter sp. DSM 110680]|uniref:Carboxypeptidase regulatory-like domain-containing protein n=1 Tax=Telmatobacter sp. DSM 110680 TaxID=3036704 RepID=A0AAU7DHR8_9BACT
MVLTIPFERADRLSRPHARLAACVLFGCVLGALSTGAIAAQDDLQQIQPRPNEPTKPNQLAVVHGLVRNGASGEPLPRALVRINGDASTGVLTDGQGRFEINDVPEGPQEFTVIKPGFIDQAEAGDAGNSHEYGHNIIVVAQMGDVTFGMVPVNSIRGQIQLSTGDVAQGITVSLLRRTVQDGRAVWQNEANAKTNSDGVYRFGGLADGFYAVYTEPAMDSEAANNLVETGSGKNVARDGYASVFYPDARDFASAARIRVSGGEQAQANISLTLEPFQSVTATVTMPRAISGAGENVGVQVTDAQAHPLSYTAQYDAATHTVQASLPDGTYSFVVTQTTNPPHLMRTTESESDRALGAIFDSQSAIGEVSFAVAGHPVSNLRIPLSQQGSNPIEVTVEHGANGSQSSGDPRIFVTVSQAGGGLGDGIVNSYAEGASTGPLRGQHPAPGSYWVHTSIAPRGLCEASFTAGGASLAHEPLVLGASGSTSPLVLTLRDDCARLTLSLPDSVGLSAGEEPYYIVYAVPDFDSTEDVIPQTLRPSTGGRITLTGLTPGNYHVYTFSRPVALEYRNPAVLAALPGQAIALAPGAEADLAVEVPQR